MLLWPSVVNSGAVSVRALVNEGNLASLTKGGFQGSRSKFANKPPDARLQRGEGARPVEGEIASIAAEHRFYDREYKPALQSQQNSGIPFTQ
jgi:hypothetical protein